MERKYKYDDFARKGIYLYLYLWNIVREIMVIIKVLIIYIFYISIVILRFVLNGNSDWLFLRICWSSRLDGDLKPLLDSLERAIGTPAAFPSWLKTSVVGFVGACFPFLSLVPSRPRTPTPLFYCWKTARESSNFC